MKSNSRYSPSPGGVCYFIIRIDFCPVELCLPPLSDQRGQALPCGEEGAMVEAQPCLLTALAGAEARGWLIRDSGGAEERPSDEFGTGRSAIQACRQAVLECTAQITKRGPPATTSPTMSGCCCPLCHCCPRCHCCPLCHCPASPSPDMASGRGQTAARALGPSPQPPTMCRQCSSLLAALPVRFCFYKGFWSLPSLNKQEFH